MFRQHKKTLIISSVIILIPMLVGLLLGTFRNEAFGLHSRYTYTNCECAMVLTSKGKTLVLAAKTPEETEIIYTELLVKLED